MNFVLKKAYDACKRSVIYGTSIVSAHGNILPPSPYTCFVVKFWILSLLVHVYSLFVVVVLIQVVNVRTLLISDREHIRSEQKKVPV